MSSFYFIYCRIQSNQIKKLCKKACGRGEKTVTATDLKLIGSQVVDLLPLSNDCIQCDETVCQNSGCHEKLRIS